MRSALCIHDLATATETVVLETKRLIEAPDPRLSGTSIAEPEPARIWNTVSPASGTNAST